MDFAAWVASWIIAIAIGAIFGSLVLRFVAVFILRRVKPEWCKPRDGEWNTSPSGSFRYRVNYPKRERE